VGEPASRNVRRLCRSASILHRMTAALSLSGTSRRLARIRTVLKEEVALMSRNPALAGAA